MTRPVPMTEQPATPEATATTHYVTDEQALAAALGRYPRALCGREFRPACLLTPPGHTCPECRAAARAISPPPPPRRPVRRTPALRRLLALRAHRR